MDSMARYLNFHDFMINSNFPAFRGEYPQGEVAGVVVVFPIRMAKLGKAYPRQLVAAPTLVEVVEM